MSEFINHHHPRIQKFVNEIAGSGSQKEKAVALFYAVRDSLRYDPYTISLKPEDHAADAVLASGHGFCVSKAVVLAACFRAIGLEANIGFADVKNHLTTPKLRALMGTDVFHYHGYTQLMLNGESYKLTPAFDAALCKRFGVKTLEWDGSHDALFHEFDENQQKHMEYLHDYGTREDLPFSEMMSEYKKYYPALFLPENNRAVAPADEFESIS